MIQIIKGFSGGLSGKEPACNVGSPPGDLPNLFFQGIFPTQGSNLHLLHWQVDFFFFLTTVPPRNEKKKLKETHSQKVCNPYFNYRDINANHKKRRQKKLIFLKN